MACLVALVLTQALGLAHRVAHGAGVPANEAVTQHEHNALEALFPHHDAADCLLLDGLLPGACSTATPSLPALLPPVGLLAQGHADFVARQAALFDARGPPVSR